MEQLTPGVIATEQNEVRMQPVKLPNDSRKAIRSHVGALHMHIRHEENAQWPRSRELGGFQLDRTNDRVGCRFAIAGAEHSGESANHDNNDEAAATHVGGLRVSDEDQNRMERMHASQNSGLVTISARSNGW